MKLDRKWKSEGGVCAGPINPNNELDRDLDTGSFDGGRSSRLATAIVVRPRVARSITTAVVAC